jgi:hypothetical protein
MTMGVCGAVCWAVVGPFRVRSRRLAQCVCVCVREGTLSGDFEAVAGPCTLELLCRMIVYLPCVRASWGEAGCTISPPPLCACHVPTSPLPVRAQSSCCMHHSPHTRSPSQATVALWPYSSRTPGLFVPVAAMPPSLLRVCFHFPAAAVG